MSSDQDEGSSSDSVEYQYELHSGKTSSVYVRRGKSSQIINGYSGNNMDDHDDDQQPYIEIIEQPQARGFRFRYECEGPSHGGLQGEKSEKYRKTFPAIKIKNFNGPSRVVVTLVTDEDIPRPHAHKLVGKNCNEGTCIVELKTGNNTATFPNLCVQHVTRRRAAEVIEQRILESIKLDKLIKLGDLNGKAELTQNDIEQAKSQATGLAKNMQLNVVRLCFQAYLRGEDGQFSRLLQSVLSNPIYDSKSPGANALKICRMDKYGGCCTGNEEVFLLCEKVQKDDIDVRFVEQDDDGNVVWEAKGNFGPFDVHRQYAIVFKTPPYKDTYIDRAVNVLIMLQRKSDGETSDPKSFTYYPQNIDKEDIARKRRKQLPSYPGNGGFGSSGSSGGRVGTGSNGLFVSLQASQGNMPTTVTQDNQDSDVPVQPKNRPMARRKASRQREQAQNDLEMDCVVYAQTSVPYQQTFPTDKQFEVQQTVAMAPSPYPLQPGNANGSMGYPTVEQFPISNSSFTFTMPQMSHPLMSKPVVAQPSQMMYTNNGFTARGGSYSGEPVLKDISEMSNRPYHCSFMDETDGGCAEDKNSEKCTSANLPEVGSKVNIHNVGKEQVQPTGTTVIDANIIRDDVTDGVDIEIVKQTDVTVVAKHKQSLKARVKFPSEGSDYRHSAVQTEEDGEVQIAQRTAKALQLYAATGDIRQLLMVQRFLSYIADEAGDLPLHTCIINHQLEVVHNLLDVMCSLPDARRKINAHNRHLQTPLHLAVLTGQVGVVELLLKTGAEPTVLDRNGNTAAHLAVLFGQDKCLATLLKYVRPGMRKDCPFPELDVKNFDGLTPVHIAAQKENINAMKLLVQGKADVNMEAGKCGRTALHFAANSDNLSMVGWLLLEAGAAVNAACFDGNTALHIACGRQNIGMVALLMAVGANPDIENYDFGDDSDSQDEVDKEENENNCHRPKSKQGHTPEDFAMDNQKVLQVLHGQPYTSPGEIQEEADRRDYEQKTSFYTSLILASGRSPNSGHGGFRLIEEGGDMERVTYPVRVQLSKLLDPVKAGKDWRALSDELGFSRVLQGHQSGHSPTRLLLTYFEECGGTVKHLIDALNNIKRPDAATLISSNITMETESVTQSMGNIDLTRVNTRSDSIHTSHTSPTTVT